MSEAILGIEIFHELHLDQLLTRSPWLKWKLGISKKIAESFNTERNIAHRLNFFRARGKYEKALIRHLEIDTPLPDSLTIPINNYFVRDDIATGCIQHYELPVHLSVPMVTERQEGIKS